MPTEPDWLDRSEKLCSVLDRKRPVSVSRSEVSEDAKLPFSANVLIGSLLHRASELANVSCELYRQGRTISAMTVTRSHMETTALMFMLNLKIDEAIKNQSVEDVGSFLEKSLTGSRYFEGDNPSPSVQSALEKHVARDHEHFWDMYKYLSEHAHPSPLGTSDAFSRFEPESQTTVFRFQANLVEQTDGLIALASSLGLLLSTQVEIGRKMADFTGLCERFL